VNGLPPLHLFDDVAEAYRISLRELNEAARARQFEHTHIGAKRYFTDEQLQAFLNGRAVKAARADDGLAGVRARRARRRTRAAA
jgi:hypothetical protein